MNMPEKMSLDSMNVAESKIARLQEVLPEVFSDGKVDIDQLKRVLGNLIDAGKERFGLSWPGKSDCMRVIQEQSVGTLKPVRTQSAEFDSTENVFIEGDNLEVLKVLQKSYFGKIKLIYIDPPYNTGEDFIYPDKYAESLDTYLAYTGQKDHKGKPVSTEQDRVGRFHSRWLNMMYPRLYLATNLLKDTGAIFISIDDAESANLKKLCDEIFGEENFIAQMVWEGAFKNDARQIGTNHEYVLAYAKNRSALNESWSIKKEAAEPVLKEVARLKALHGTNYDAASEELAGWFRANKAKPCYAHRRFRYIDKHGAYKEDDPTAPGGRRFDLINPKTGQVIPLRRNRGWAFDQETFNRLVDEGKISFVSPTSIMVRRYFHETDKVTPQSVFYQPARSASERLAGLLGVNAFDFPKDETIIEQFVEMATEDEDDIVLDFFAGSATTAHAVMRHNAKTGRKLRYIMVQLPEPCVKDSVAASAGYKTIADIGRDRIKKAAAVLEADGSAQLDLEITHPIDCGFRAFRLDQSNFKVWSGQTEDVESQLELHIENVVQSASQEDIVFELLLKSGFPLTTKVAEVQLAGKRVFSIADGSLLICLERDITMELVDAIADADPLQVICLDEAFKGNDQLKTNAVQTFKARAASQESEIVFKTV